MAKKPTAADILDAQDEYTLDLYDQIDDESVQDERRTLRFNITSYGVDYTVDSLVKRVDTGAFFVPDFQRAYVWSQRNASSFIESLLLGLPVPGIFLYKEPKTGRHLIIDGQQRLVSLHRFINKKIFGERSFRLLEVTEPWENLSHDELNEADRQRLDDAIIHTTVFQQDEPQAGDQSVYYVFQRINSGGVRLSHQEIRSCINHGPFISLLRELNEGESWRSIFGPKNKRQKDQELILRFLALKNSKYTRPMNEFLNKFMERHRNINSRDAEEFKKSFISTTDLAVKALGDRPFRPERALNAAVFDGVMIGLAKRLEAGKIRDVHALRIAYDELLKTDEFRDRYLQSTSDEDNVRERIRLATAAFSNIS